MKKFKKLTSLVLALSMCMSMLVAVSPASHAAGTITEGETVDPSYAGVVISAVQSTDSSNSGKYYTVNFGVQNVNRFDSAGVAVEYDPSVLDICTSDGFDVLESVEALNFITATADMGVDASVAGRPWSTVFTGVVATSSVDSKTSIIYSAVNIKNASEATYTKFGIDMDAGGIALNKNNTVHNIYSLHFKLKDGKDFSDITKINITPGEDSQSFHYSFPNGAGIHTDISSVQSANAEIYNTIYKKGFPAADVTPTPTPTTTTTTDPVVKHNVTLTIKDSNGSPAANATVKLYKQTAAPAVLEAATTPNYTGTTNSDGKVTFSVEDGTYEYEVTLAGHKTNTGGTLTVSGVDIANKEVAMEKADSSVTGPKYSIKGTYDKATTTFTVKVNVHDVKAAGGAFGLKFDPTIAKLKTSPINPDQLAPVKVESPAVLTDGYQPIINQEKGYYIVYWTGSITQGEYFDATGMADGKLLLTYQFKMTEEDFNTKVNKDTFALMPYTDAEEAITDPAIYRAFWSEATGSYCVGDADNVANVIEMPMDISFNNDNKSAIKFNVKTSETGNVAIAGTEVKVKKEDATSETGFADVATVTTDTNGEAYVAVENGTYYYEIANEDYWKIPDPRPSIAAGHPNKTATVIVDNGEKQVNVNLDPYAQRKVSWDLSDNPKGDVEHGKIKGNGAEASETGNETITEGTDYGFTVVAPEGYTITRVASVINGTETNIDYNDTLQKYVVPGEAICGDVVLYAVFDRGSYTLEAKAGTGGKVRAGIEGANQTGASVTVYYGQSGTFVFVANEGKEIDKVIVNGEEKPFEGSLKTYQQDFTNVKANQTVSVTFKDEEAENGQSSTISMSVGKNGKLEITQPIPQTISGQKSQDYIIENGQTFMANVVPDTDFIIDKLYVDGQEVTITNPAISTPVKGGGFAADGQSHSIIVTFKAADAVDPAQCVVSSRVASGQGWIMPLGATIYAAGADAKYVIVPDAQWHIKKVYASKMGTTVMSDVTAEVTAEGKNEYTFSALAENKVLVVYFEEDGHAVSGSVTYAQSEDGATKTDDELLVERENFDTNPDAMGAKVIFTRKRDGKVFEMYTARTGARGVFSDTLPVGTYTMRVVKFGHLPFEVTDIEITESTASLQIPEITLTPGNVITTADELAEKLYMINMFDIYQSSTSMSSNDATVKIVCDVNQDATYDTTDSSFVVANQTKKLIPMTWTEFTTPPAPAAN
jgi:5-hydroxyisourate hydrolase-like protein (transthyretin family)